MSVFRNYQVDEGYNGSRIEEGEHLLTISKAAERVSTHSGNELLEIELHTKNGGRLFYHIVEGDLFNKKLTQFYDCFGIPRGNQNFHSWIGRSGKAFVAKGKVQSNGKQYHEIKYLINPPQAQRNHNAGSPPASSRQQPSVTTRPPQHGNSSDPKFDDDIPF